MDEFDDEVGRWNFWPSVADLFLTLFIIATAIVAAVFFVTLPTNNVGKDRAVVQAVGSDLRRVRDPVNDLRTVLKLEMIAREAGAGKVMSALSETSNKGVDEIITLHEGVKKLEMENESLKDSLSKIASKDLVSQNEELRTKNAEYKLQFEQQKKQIEQLEKQLGMGTGSIQNLIQQNAEMSRLLNDKPPIIQISEQKEDYRFESGSSSMGHKFIVGLQENEFSRIAKEIVDRQEEGRAKVDTLEIIGHTDGIPLSAKGNLDDRLPAFIAGGSRKIEELRPGSNNDLGLLRALAVRNQWEQYIKSDSVSVVDRQILQKIHVRCYSAGQTILPEMIEDPKPSDFQREDPKARRIELRLTRLKE